MFSQGQIRKSEEKQQTLTNFHHFYLKMLPFAQTHSRAIRPELQRDRHQSACNNADKCLLIN